MARSVRRLVAAGLVIASALVASAGIASAQTVTVTFGPIEIIQRVGQLTLTIEEGEIIQEGRVLQIIEGEELVFPLPPQLEVIEGEELIFYLPRQSFTFDAGVPSDGGTGGGNGGARPERESRPRVSGRVGRAGGRPPLVRPPFQGAGVPNHPPADVRDGTVAAGAPVPV